MSFFIRNPGGKFYLREIQRLTGEPVGALQRELKELVKTELLVSEPVGPLKYFLLNQNHPFLSELRSLFLKEHRFKLLEKNLRRVLKILRSVYHPDRVILYGSFASGHIRADSDLDLLIVKKDVPSRYWDRVKEVAPIFAGCDVGVDYSIWTPKELEAGREKPFIKNEILRKGKVLYEKRAH